MNIEHFVGYVYFVGLINAQKMEHVKVPKHILIFESKLVQKVLLCRCWVSCDPTHTLCMFSSSL
jgi:CDGSH-type Zn-finger protein